MTSIRSTIANTKPRAARGSQEPVRISGGLVHFRIVEGGSGGFTFLETMVAAFVILTALGAIFAVSNQCMRYGKTTQDVAVASSALNERMQQLQNTDWGTVTDSESYTNQVWTDPVDNTTEFVDGLMKNATAAGEELLREGAVESLSISAYRPTASADPIPAPITVTRNATTATLTSLATNLVDEKMVRIDLKLSWADRRLGAQRTQTLTRILAHN